MSMNRRMFLAASAAAPLAARAARGAGKKYRACVIGDTNHGGYGHNLHMVWGCRDDVEVVGLADPDENGRKAKANQCGAARTYADYREMLDKEKPDLVTVGPRCSDRHKQYLLDVAASGAHGIMEKPIATCLEEADVMLDAIERNNLKWAIAFNFRALPRYQHAKKLILEDKIIGDILELRGRGKEDKRSGGEDLIVLGTHVFDMMIDLAGMPQWCTADIRSGGKPAGKADVHEATEPLGLILGDTVEAQYGFEDGIYGHFATQANKDGNGGRWGLDIYGTKGIISMRLTEVPEIFWYPAPSWSPGGQGASWQPLPGMPEMVIKDAHTERNAPIINDLIAAIEEDRQPFVSLADGRNAYEMVQAVFESHAAGARVPILAAERSHPLLWWL